MCGGPHVSSRASDVHSPSVSTYLCSVLMCLEISYSSRGDASNPCGSDNTAEVDQTSRRDRESRTFPRTCLSCCHMLCRCCVRVVSPCCYLSHQCGLLTRLPFASHCTCIVMRSSVVTARNTHTPSVIPPPLLAVHWITTNVSTLHRCPGAALLIIAVFVCDFTLVISSHTHETHETHALILDLLGRVALLSLPAGCGSNPRFARSIILCLLAPYQCSLFHQGVNVLRPASHKLTHL